jgi:hypothetical protein
MLARILRASGMLDAIRTAVRADIDRGARDVREHLSRLAGSLSRLEDAQRAADERLVGIEHTLAQVRAAVLINERQRDLVAGLDARLDAGRVLTHVRERIEAAPFPRDPFPHIVVEDLLPKDVYKLALEAIPHEVFFGTRDRVKQNLRVPFDFAPTLATRVWQFLDERVFRDAIRPAALEKFRSEVAAYYESLFGAELAGEAAALPQSVSGGRLMLRRPGYHLAPHRDPKRTVLTCLIYLARSKDNEAYGTRVFRVHGDREAGYTQTFYPEEEGCRCELVKTVPFRANSALVFLNSRGAHGAEIPADAPPDVQRVSFQFYIGPDAEAFDALLRRLPQERQAMWAAKKA